MNSDQQTNQLLRVLVRVIGRVAIPLGTVQQVVGTGKKQLAAFNLSDGTLTQGEVSKKAGIDQGNLSRTFSRWVRHGIAFWVGDGKDARLSHIYPIPEKEGPRRKRPL